MATLKEIRARIGSIKNTRKITSAMSRIASARLARAQRAMLDQRPYGERMATVVGQLVAELDDAQAHPLLEQRDVRRVAVIAVTADRGLAGPFNANVNKAAEKLLRELEADGKDVVLVTVGRKARQYLEPKGFEATVQHAAPDYKTATEVAHVVTTEALSMFNEHDETATGMPQVDRVVIVYNHFKSVLNQDVKAVQLLPVPPSEHVDEARLEREFEPGLQALLDHLLPVAVETIVQTAMVNSAAAELAAKRVAMDAATDNASELIKNLTLEYNRGRQAAITSELIEIISGAEAL